jgi:hypothetical protein
VEESRGIELISFYPQPVPLRGGLDAFTEHVPEACDCSVDVRTIVNPGGRQLLAETVQGDRRPVGHDKNTEQTTQLGCQRYDARIVDHTDRSEYPDLHVNSPPSQQSSSQRAHRKHTPKRLARSEPYPRPFPVRSRRPNPAIAGDLQLGWRSASSAAIKAGLRFCAGVRGRDVDSVVTAALTTNACSAYAVPSSVLCASPVLPSARERPIGVPREHAQHDQGDHDERHDDDRQCSRRRLHQVLANGRRVGSTHGNTPARKRNTVCPGSTPTSAARTQDPSSS